MNYYFNYSEHYLPSETDAFDKLSSILEKRFTKDNARKPNQLELATELYMYAHECSRKEAIEAYDLQEKTIREFYHKVPSPDECMDAFVLAATCELIANGEVPYASGYRTYRRDYHPVAIVDCNGWDQGTPEQQAKWRELRRHYGIGGSEVAAVMGISPFGNNVSVYRNKVGIDRTNDVVDAAKQFMFDYGHQMEDPIANYYAARFKAKVRNDTVMYRHPYFPWMIADMDRRITHPSGKEAIMEIKSSNFKMKDSWEGSAVPMYYVFQTRHYMAVMNIEETVILCHFGGNTPDDMAIRTIERLRPLETSMCEEERDFWLGNVLPCNEPAPNGSGLVQSRVSEYYAQQADASRPQLEITQTYKSVIEEILDLKEQVSQIKSENGVLGKLESEIALKQDVLKKLLGSATEGVCDCDKDSFYMVTYKPSGRESIDKEALKISYPDIYDQFVEAKNEMTRTMRISKKKKGKNFVMPQNNP